MGQRIYTVPLDNITVSAIQDLFSILCGAGNGIELHHLHLEANVSAEAALRLRIKRMPTTVTQGSGGTVVTTTGTWAVDAGDPAVSGLVAHINDTTQATTTGTAQILGSFWWDVALPFDHLPAPEDREVFIGSQALVIDLPVAPTSTAISGYLKFRQIQ